MSNPRYLLKIELLEIEPPVWRRFAVPASINLRHFHVVIQAIMGWTDSHLFEFQIGEQKYTEGAECHTFRRAKQPASHDAIRSASDASSA